jgi:hypothetical protein
MADDLRPGELPIRLVPGTVEAPVRPNALGCVDLTRDGIWPGLPAGDPPPDVQRGAQR